MGPPVQGAAPENHFFFFQPACGQQPRGYLSGNNHPVAEVEHGQAQRMGIRGRYRCPENFNRTRQIDQHGFSFGISEDYWT